MLIRDFGRLNLPSGQDKIPTLGRDLSHIIETVEFQSFTTKTHHHNLSYQRYKKSTVLPRGRVYYFGCFSTKN